MWYIILLLITGIYLYINILMPAGGLFETYVVRPLIWVGLAVITFIIAHNEGLNILKFKKIRRWYLGKNPLHAGLLLGGFQVALLIIVGIFFGFGRSPYSFTPYFIMINLFFVGSFVVGTEISRAYLIKKSTASTRKYLTIWLILITLLFLFIRLTPADFAKLDFSTPEVALEFLGSVFITTLAMSLLASYLSYLGGATASIGYIGTIMAFEWFSPILPNPHWTILALVGTIAPAIGFVILQDSIQPALEKPIRRPRKKPIGHGWTIVAIFTVIIVFFSYGYLGVEPTVIYSGSMKPAFDVGDIVLVDDVDPDSIETGDIIQFIRDDVPILHRVVEIREDEDGRSFIVKGDANEEPDSEPVSENQIIGKAVLTIPELGWIQIFFKDLFKGLPNPIN